MISKRMLEKWRKDSLRIKSQDGWIDLVFYEILNKRVLRMTQELLDLHLINKEKKEKKDDN